MAHPLQDRTRYDPAETESRVFQRWFESGRFHPEPAAVPAGSGWKRPDSNQRAKTRDSVSAGS